MQIIPKHQLFTVGDPKRRYTSMVQALQALYRSSRGPHYLAITLLVTCYMDAMAARGGRATKQKFLGFLRRNFNPLCAGLNGREPRLDGAEVFYKFYRSEMAHTFFSRNPKYLIAEDHELKGAYVDDLQIKGRARICVAVNADRLYRDFVALAKRRAKQATL